VPSPPPVRIIVADANVLINLIHVGQLALLGALPGYEFIVPHDVVSEITEVQQRATLEAALAAGHLRQESITDPQELAGYAELRAIMGRGEAACLALAESRGWLIASDEKRPLRREVDSRIGPGRLITTPGLFILAIRAGVLTIEEADCAKNLLEQRRFRMSFHSFRDVAGAQ
jgi:predicted nucleic acid-binding protein